MMEVRIELRLRTECLLRSLLSAEGEKAHVQEVFEEPGVINVIDSKISQTLSEEM